ncbi:hypothetical protein, partial [Sphingobium sp. Ant17]|uniref:hypothetical protein n=1 Tax=Sphingobium sp. Ant17 TaxID=1461752 RepID=UPI001F43A993
LVANNVATFQRFHTNGFILVDALLGYDLGRASSSLEAGAWPLMLPICWTRRISAPALLTTAAIMAHHARWLGRSAIAGKSRRLDVAIKEKHGRQLARFFVRGRPCPTLLRHS